MFCETGKRGDGETRSMRLVLCPVPSCLQIICSFILARPGRRPVNIGELFSIETADDRQHLFGDWYGRVGIHHFCILLLYPHPVVQFIDWLRWDDGFRLWGFRCCACLPVQSWALAGLGPAAPIPLRQETTDRQRG